MYKQTNNCLIKKLFSYFNKKINENSILPGYLEKILVKNIQLYPNEIIKLILSEKEIIQNLFLNIENDSVSNILYELLNIESLSNLSLEFQEYEVIYSFIIRDYFRS